jgi:iron-sulfur cluster repair protein YtfE (RIC family)
VSTTARPTRIDFDDLLIRDVVERFPETMAVLADAGLDLCCGGGHTIPEAARLHGLEAEALIAAVDAAIESRTA